ncbi:hypothetical protein BT93_C1494 [Corymbia citriodora subsp. variegata]|nr:hypothetical protein BT93_C1494 [Corymbia citriodora subsp. variegata]
MRSRSSSTSSSPWRQVRGRKIRVKNMMSTRRKLHQLLSIVPGCDQIHPQNLFHTIATYIHLLELKVSLLTTLSSSYGV